MGTTPFGEMLMPDDFSARIDGDVVGSLTGASNFAAAGISTTEGGCFCDPRIMNDAEEVFFFLRFLDLVDVFLADSLFGLSCPKPVSFPLRIKTTAKAQSGKNLTDFSINYSP